MVKRVWGRRGGEEAEGVVGLIAKSLKVVFFVFVWMVFFMSIYPLEWVDLMCGLREAIIGSGCVSE